MVLEKNILFLIALNNVAAKLGATAEHLWGVLLKQAPIYGITSTLTLLVALVV